ncbi:LysR family transcriptional regulator [Marivivens donghaensis]|uniref:LysR family transcriptional regulator n=1 Tax=Marivivens donghaensis TaxID=1699413 RepID=A0ABX0W1H3_9RHOB|nr:LysR family transcriptional regulator [Marivivens donghaensis]NIY72748.1 LysR family transcriptional regulator [Marivivens donghaensis]
MDLTEELRAFVATAQTGSFTAAADHLGVSNRLTSKYVAELEARLGVRLFQRTTRRVGLTPAGEDLLARAPALLDDLDELMAEVSCGSRGLTGMIRVSAPVTLGEIYICGMLGRFAKEHPKLEIDLRLSDTYVDLASDGIDVAFRMGLSERLSLKTRKLGAFQLMAVASPEYLAAHGTPETPADLENHTCIIDMNRRQPRRWTFRKDGEEFAVNVSGQFRVNSAVASCELACAGLGIVYTPRFAMSKALAKGDLVPVLPDYDTNAGPLSAVYLEGRALPRKIRALIDFAAEDVKSSGIL